MSSVTGFRHWINSRSDGSVGLIGILFGGVFAVFVAIYIHEITHQFVYAQYGCRSSISLLPSVGDFIAITEPATECMVSLSPGRRRELYSHQLMVEATGYQIVPLYGIIGGVVGFVLATDLTR